MISRRERFEQWLRSVERLHEGFTHCSNEELRWTPLRNALERCRVALVTTAGVHRVHDRPFDVDNPAGDWTFRRIPADVESSSLVVTHAHYDHGDADQDINCVFPIDRLKDLARSGEIGEVAPTHYGLMGWIPNPTRLRDETAPAIARELVASVVDVALLTAG